MRSIHGILIICSAALMAIGSALASTVERIATFILSWGSASPPLELAGGFGLPLNQRGRSLDAALQNDLRHEAGVSRRSADRNT